MDIRKCFAGTGDRKGKTSIVNETEPCEGPIVSQLNIEYDLRMLNQPRNTGRPDIGPS
jgi:hypothetical protein